MNTKKMLCFNILNGRNCCYGKKCMYAHNLEEQKIEPIRERVYNIIQTSKNLATIDLIMDCQLFDTMLQLTRICPQCSRNDCPGGYNCRNGAINNSYRICYDDLIYGTCKKSSCCSIHLSKNGLIPYVKQQAIRDKKKNTTQYNPLKQFGKRKSEINLSSDSEGDEKVCVTMDYFNVRDSDSENDSIFKN